MKTLLTCTAATLLLTLAACGSDEKTTIVHEKPIIIAPAAQASPTSTSVEHMCKNGYDNATRSCY